MQMKFHSHNILIKKARSQHMSNIANADTKRLWQAVSGKRGNGHDNICSNVGTDYQYFGAHVQ